MLPSDQHFFGLTPEYKLSLLELIYHMVKHMNFSYSDVLNMPIFERNLFIDFWQKEMERERKEYERAKNKKR
jgi:hypothetical protein